MRLGPIRTEVGHTHLSTCLVYVRKDTVSQSDYVPMQDKWVPSSHGKLVGTVPRSYLV